MQTKMTIASSFSLLERLSSIFRIKCDLNINININNNNIITGGSSGVFVNDNDASLVQRCNWQLSFLS